MECNKSWWEINEAGLYPLSTKQDPFLMCLQSFKLKAQYSLHSRLMSSSPTLLLQDYIVRGYRNNYDKFLSDRPAFGKMWLAHLKKKKRFTIVRARLFANVCSSQNSCEWHDMHFYLFSIWFMHRNDKKRKKFLRLRWENLIKAKSNGNRQMETVTNRLKN